MEEKQVYISTKQGNCGCGAKRMGNWGDRLDYMYKGLSYNYWPCTKEEFFL